MKTLNMTVSTKPVRPQYIQFFPLGWKHLIVVGGIQDKLVKRFNKQLSPSANSPGVAELRKSLGNSIW